MLCEKGSVSDLQRKDIAGEVKYDGTRALVIKRNGDLAIQNRKGIDYTRRLLEVTDAAKKIPTTFVLDGEVCYFNAEGVSEFTPCQQRCSTQNVSKQWALKRLYPVTFMAFDVLELDGADYRRKPYVERKQALHKLLSA